MIICDTREKKNGHIIDYFERFGIEYAVRKLDVGDYMIAGGKVSVDTKRSIDELASNMLNPSDHSRFWKEVRRSRESGIHLVVLIESNKYKSIKDLSEWRSKYSRICGRPVMDAVYRCHISYGVDFLFCPHVSAGKRIFEILIGGEANDNARDNGHDP